MVRIILSGCNGHMGHVISHSVAQRDDCTVVAGIDLNTEMRQGYPVFSTAAECSAEADVIVDFSHPAALDSLLAMAVSKKLPVVVATTGLSQEQVAKVRETARTIPVFYTANMSLGINLMQELCKTAARVLGAGFDIEIVEKHHNQKIDAPSGTALMLADSISEALPATPQYVYDRHSQRKKRTKNEIGLHAVRGGTIVGEHEVIFAGRDEVFTIHHSAASKEIFATGALSAAVFLAGKPTGLYTMADVIEPV